MIRLIAYHGRRTSTHHGGDYHTNRLGGGVGGYAEKLLCSMSLGLLRLIPKSNPKWGASGLKGTKTPHNLAYKKFDIESETY